VLFENLSFDKHLSLYVISYFFLVVYLLIEGLILQRISILFLALFFLLKANQKDNMFLPYNTFLNLSPQTSHFFLVCLLVIFLLFGIPRTVYCMPEPAEIPKSLAALHVEAQQDALITVAGFSAAAALGAMQRTSTRAKPLGELAAVLSDTKFGFGSGVVAAASNFPSAEQLQNKKDTMGLVHKFRTGSFVEDETVASLRRRSDEILEELRQQSLERSRNEANNEVRRSLDRKLSIEEETKLLDKFSSGEQKTVPTKGFWELVMDCFSS